MQWKVSNLSKKAVSISASRRTDIPAFFGKWFSNRLKAGFAEYIAPRSGRCSCSLRPEDVTHMTFWSKNPRPFFPVLKDVQKIGYPSLFNVTITGLGGTRVEPFVPPADKVVAAVQELAKMLPPKAVVWRYVPIFMSTLYDARHHVETFTRLCGDLAEHVDRVAVSFPEVYGRRVQPDLQRYQNETGDQWQDMSIEQQAEFETTLDGIAKRAGLKVTVCCNEESRAITGLPSSECNSFAWACRVYEELREAKPLKRKATRAGCRCCEEHDIGCFDTCIHGCRYSYGSISYKIAAAKYAKHDPKGPCLIPADSLPLVAAAPRRCSGCSGHLA